MGNKVTNAKYARTLTIMLLAALLAGTAMLAACGDGGGGAQTAQIGDNVSVLYVGTLDNGSVFQSSAADFNNKPLQFVIGDHKVLPDFENAVVNMSANQSTKIHISAENAYGPTEITYNLSSTDTPPTAGQQYQVRLDNGKVIIAVAANVTNTSVTFQNTHALAGQNLTFQITLVEIVKKQ